MAAPEAVVDSSVIVKWFLPEPLRPEAVRLLRSYQEHKVRLLAPALAVAEVSNVFCKRSRRGELSPAAVNQAYRLLKTCAPILIADAELMDDAVRLALSSGQAVYDCLYLALALHRGCEMITADARFHGSMSLSFPMVLRL
jgi:predicted nucleic acid-binding protein